MRVSATLWSPVVTASHSEAQQLLRAPTVIQAAVLRLQRALLRLLLLAFGVPATAAHVHTFGFVNLIKLFV